MKKNIDYIIVGQGAIRACVLTLLLLVAFTGITMLVGENESVKSVAYMMFTCVSVLYGSAYAAKKAGKNGWIMGLLVALIYSVFVYFASVGAGREAIFVLRDAIRFGMAIIVGVLSGMIGINL